ncbi:unnamed protein product [Phytophthora fragariaefolia]|uniref:Unnamed protein product n=1 Tax=Phytophthora fragariaefolia TaxID=1490495 RepID=A0A9W6YDJ0_9STRA|nr:unnamed protein product [Phytophthora fragariaefolia]
MWGGADYLVLNNIVQYASADLRTVLMAKVDGTRTDYLVTACGKEQTVKLVDVYYGTLDRKGFALTERDGRRVLAGKNRGRVVFFVELQRSVLVMHARVVKRREDTSKVIMAVLDKVVTKPGNVSSDVQKGTLVEFYQRMRHLNYDADERLALDPNSGIELTDRRRVNCLTWAQGKQTKNNRPKVDTGSNPPIDRVGDVICSDLKCPMTPRDRLNNRYMINFPTPSLGEIVVFGSPCTVYRDPVKKNFAQRAQQGMIVGIGEETKGYRVYLPKDKLVVTTQHVRNIETLDKVQNENVQNLYLQDNETEAEEETVGDAAVAVSSSKKKSRQRKKKGYARERHVTRSVARQTEEKAAEATEQEESSNDVVSSVTEMDPKNYREAMRSRLRAQWSEAIRDELRALEENGVWMVVRRPRGVRVLHTKWVFKTKRDAEGVIERLNARLVACGNEQEFGVNYSVTFAAVIEMSSVKLILALTRKWRVPAKHGDVPNAYVKAKKEAELAIYIRIPQGMEIPRQEVVILVVDVYVDDLLVTGTQQEAVGAFFSELTALPIKDLGHSSKFLGIRVNYREEEGCDLDQEIAILDMMKEYEMEFTHSVSTPIGAQCNEHQEAGDEKLPVSGAEIVVTVRQFQSLVGSFMWVARCTRPDIAFAVHKV